MKVCIDQDLCTGDGLCTDHCPDLFILLDDGISYVRDTTTGLAASDPGGPSPATCRCCRAWTPRRTVRVLVHGARQVRHAFVAVQAPEAVTSTAPKNGRTMFPRLVQSKDLKWSVRLHYKKGRPPRA